MIKGTDKPFKQGNPFKYPLFKKLSDNRKGRPCANCGRYKKMDQFTGPDEDCNKCKLI